LQFNKLFNAQETRVLKHFIYQSAKICFRLFRLLHLSMSSIMTYAMQSLRDTVITLGADVKLPKYERRSVILCNRLCFLFALIVILNIVLVLLISGHKRITLPLVILPFILLTPIIFNKYGHTTISRILLSWAPPIVTTIYSVHSKLHGQDLETSGYIALRITLITYTIIPFLVFSLRQRILMPLALSVPLILLIGFDPIHSLFGIGYTQVGLTDATYELTTMRALIAVLVLGGGSLLLKQMFEESEDTNTRLLDELHDKNQEVETQIEEIVSQNKKINIQNEDIQTQKQILEYRFQDILEKNQALYRSQESLKQAQQTIEEQKRILSSQNKQLELELLNRNKELEKINQDLIQTNNNLNQYSYMVSHNLRGPVASIIGLLNIIPQDKLDPTLMSIYEKTYTSILQLDSVIREIHVLIDSEKSLVNIKQKIYWENVVKASLQLYQQEIDQFGIQITLNFVQAPFIISIKNLIESILDNLISNAIKFRAPNRTLHIHMETRIEDHQMVFQITDNGLGINLASQKDSLFKMYKRLHTHVEGKGLGLYMTKMQIELLHGTIDVDSELNHHTTFTLRLPITDTGKQVIIDNDACCMSYNILNGSFENHFKRNFTSEEFRTNYLKALEYFKKFKVNSVLDDMRSSNAPTPEDQEWFRKTITPDAGKNGLKKVAIITLPLGNSSDLKKYISIGEITSNEFGIESRIYTNVDDANEWLTAHQEQNKTA